MFYFYFILFFSSLKHIYSHIPIKFILSTTNSYFILYVSPSFFFFPTFFFKFQKANQILHIYSQIPTQNSIKNVWIYCLFLINFIILLYLSLSLSFSKASCYYYYYYYYLQRKGMRYLLYNKEYKFKFLKTLLESHLKQMVKNIGFLLFNSPNQDGIDFHMRCQHITLILINWIKIKVQ